MQRRPFVLCLLIGLSLSWLATSPAHAAKPLRAGMIGLDTSHAPAFVKLMNNPKATGPLADVEVTAAFSVGSDDIPESRDRVKKFTDAVRNQGVEMCGSIDELLSKVDVVLIESVDGRAHLGQVKPVFAAGKPVFIDKPVAGSLADAIEIFRLAKKHNVPCFTSSSLRFSPPVWEMRTKPSVGRVMGCDAYSPFHLEPHHPDLFWYGVHGVETLLTIMGPDVETVTRAHADAAEVAVGVWKDGRVGSFRGIHQGKLSYGATVFGSKRVASFEAPPGYEPLVTQIASFFKTGKPPVSHEETLAIFAFMEAADQSKREGGRPVRVADVMKKAEAEVDARWEKTKKE